jgi:hypothetical protein
MSFTPNTNLQATPDFSYFQFILNFYPIVTYKS